MSVCVWRGEMVGMYACVVCPCRECRSSYVMSFWWDDVIHPIAVALTCVKNGVFEKKWIGVNDLRFVFEVHECIRTIY